MLRATLTSRPLINQSRPEATDGAFVGKYYLITRRINTLIVRSPMQIRVEHDRVHLLVAPLPEECFGCNCVRCPLRCAQRHFSCSLATITMPVSGSNRGNSFILHCLIKITDWRNTTPRKYRPMPDLWTMGATLNGTAVITTVPNVEISLIVKTAIENERPAPIWESCITGKTMMS